MTRTGTSEVEQRDADAARAAKVRRNAWLLGAVAVLVYLGYIAWMAVRASSGG